MPPARFEGQYRTEQSFLSGILRNPQSLAEAAPLLRADDLTEDGHQRIYKAALALWDGAKVVDLATLADALFKSGDIDNIGGYGYLAELYDTEPTGCLVVQHAEILRDNALLRRLSTVGGAIQYAAEHPSGSAEEMLQEAEKSIFRIAQIGLAGQAIPLAQVVAETFDRLDARTRAGQPISGLATGFPALDTVTAGLQDSELIVLAARPSIGKTSIGLTIACNAARSGRTVFFASIEQSRVELAERLLCAEAGIDAQHVRQGSLTDRESERFFAVGQDLGGLPFFIDDSPGQSVLRIASHARRLKLRHALGLVVVDYLQLVEPDSRKEPRHEQVAGISRRLKALARELQIPVIALAQLNREVENRAGQRPRLADLRESGGIEADADVVILLHRPQDFPNNLELIVAKNRNGPTGEVTLHYDRARMRFSETHSYEPFAE